MDCWPLIALGRSWESERSCTDVHDLPWHRHAGPHAPAGTRYGAASVHGVPQLSGPRTENQPQGSLQRMWGQKDPAAEEDFGGPHWQRWEWLESLYNSCVTRWRLNQKTKDCPWITCSLTCCRNERWPEDRFPRRGRPGARNRARWHHHRLRPARTPKFHQVINMFYVIKYL